MRILIRYILIFHIWELVKVFMKPFTFQEKLLFVLFVVNDDLDIRTLSNVFQNCLRK